VTSEDDKRERFEKITNISTAVAAVVGFAILLAYFGGVLIIALSGDSIAIAVVALVVALHVIVGRILGAVLALLVSAVITILRVFPEKMWSAKSRRRSSECLVVYEKSMREIRDKLVSRKGEWERRVHELSVARSDRAGFSSNTSKGVDELIGGSYRSSRAFSDEQKPIVESVGRANTRLSILRRRLEEVDLLLKLICLDRVLLKVASVADVEPEDGRTAGEIQELLRQCDLIEREGRSICHEIGLLPNAMSVEEQVAARLSDIALHIDRFKSIGASESAGYSGGEREVFAKPGSGVRIEADLFQKVVSSVSDELKEDRLLDEGVDTRKERGR